MDEPGASVADEGAAPGPPAWLPGWPPAPGQPGPAWPGAGEVHLWWLDLRRPAWPFETMWPWLDAQEQERADRFLREPLRLRHVAAHGQMRALLAACLGTTPAAVRLDTGADGKPLLRPSAAAAPALRQGLAFNLAHSDDQGLLAIASGAVPLGADIEMLRPMNDAEALAHRYFAAAESAALRALPAAQRPAAFLAAWTRKEAYLKALGAGLRAGTASFEVTLRPQEPPRLLAIEGDVAAAAEWTLWSGQPTPASIAAVAVRARSATVVCHTLPSGTPPP
ncbi:MAG: 4'-phosphopantetheinyl transferase superfamily protein [Rubrivivax sp.]|nr:4'-phosphopantetheinyl transferase superfamily protein [Rubrivivax sp.]